MDTERFIDYFRDKVSVVTGGAAGIGAGLARALAEMHGSVVVTDLDGDQAERLASELREEGYTAISCPADVCRGEDLQHAVDLALENFGRLDVMINNAGVGLAGELRDVELSDWKPIIDVNVWGVIHGVHACFPVMLRQGHGQIVNIASAAGLVPRPGMVPYATAKHAVVGLSSSLRVEVEDLGIRVNVVCPFNVATSIFQNTVYRNLDHDGMLAAIPMRQFPLDRCVRRILQGISRNRGIITIPGFATFEWWAYRMFPPLAHLMLRRRRSIFRRFRIQNES